MSFRSTTQEKPVIDLNGPQGNAFCLFGMVSQYGKQLNWNKEKIDNVLKEMRESDYVHLVRVFEREFGDYLEIIVPPALEPELIDEGSFWRFDNQ